MTSPVLENDLRAAIRAIPDYPKPGIVFRDITTLLGNARAFRRTVDELVQPWAGSKVDKVAGIETPDDRTVKFIFKEPFLDFLVLYGSPASGAIP